MPEAIRGAGRAEERQRQPRSWRPRAGLWGHRDFLLLWGGQTVSEMGSAVTQLALPLTAVVLLRAGQLARRIGSARIIWVSILVFAAPSLLVPLARPGWAVAFFPVGYAFEFFAGVVYNVAQVSYRQTICPAGLLGRMNAATRWIVWGTLPLGAVFLAPRCNA